MKTVRVTFQHKSQLIQQSAPFEVFDSCTLETIQEEIPRKLSNIFRIKEQDLIILGYMVISEVNQEPYNRLNDIIERIKGLCPTPESYRKLMLKIEDKIEVFHKNSFNN